MPNRKALDKLHGLEKVRPTLKRKVVAHKLKTPKGAPECKEPCVMSAFQEWQDANLTPPCPQASGWSLNSSAL
jgi:hypothetical protein